ncbi:MAG TPA: GNAT family N-acetyltransferase [Pseudonocardiaceae bacterium]
MRLTVLLAVRELVADLGSGLKDCLAMGRQPVPGSSVAPADDVRVRQHVGSREELRSLFELAEDSRAQLDSYLAAGRVLVAVRGTDVLGHLQLVETDRAGQFEIKNMAVREDCQGRGVGARLVRAAVDLVEAEAGSVLVVATAAADIGNLRFYQRQGFRMRAIERDAFTPATGYPAGISIDGIELRDRVWLDRPQTSGDAARSTD